MVSASLLLELGGHSMMGVAVGLAFAFLVLHIPSLGIGTLIGHCLDPAGMLRMFVGVCAIAFGIGATLTALLFIFEDNG